MEIQRLTRNLVAYEALVAAGVRAVAVNILRETGIAGLKAAIATGAITLTTKELAIIADKLGITPAVLADKLKSDSTDTQISDNDNVTIPSTGTFNPKPPDDDEDKYSWPDNRVPKDKETILSDKTKYTDTGRIGPDNRKIYKGSDGNYYHMDNLHQGKGAEIEVYGKNGNHVGTANPKTGTIDKTQAFSGRNIKKYL